MDNPVANRKLFLIFILSALLLLVHVWYYYPFTSDDSFISYRYAERMLAGKGLTWTDGRRVEGYSNLLWILLLALLRVITHIEFWILALLLSLFCTLLTLWLLLRLVGRITNSNFLALAICAGLFVVSGPVAIWVNGGLEGPLVMVLLMSALLFLTIKTGASGIISAGLFLGLVAITRPDGIVFTVAVAIGFWGFHFKGVDSEKRLTRQMRPLLFLSIIPLLFYIAQLVFRLFYYCEWVPNTALVKVKFNWMRVREGVSYVKDMLLVYFPFLLLAIYFLRKTHSYRSWLSFFLIVVFIFSFYLVLIGGDFFPGFRHGLPLVPILCAIAGVSVMLWAHQVELSRLFVAILSTVLILVVFVVQFFSINNSRARMERWEWDARAIGQSLKTGMETWKPSIAVSCAGTLPYYMPFPALDLLGLNDYYLPRHPPKNFGYGPLGHELGNAEYYLSQAPDIFMLNGFGGYKPVMFPQEIRLSQMPLFQTEYVGVRVLCNFDYKLFLPVCERGFPTYIKKSEVAYPYIRKYSPRIGIRKIDSGTILIPAWFLLRQNEKDSSPLLRLDDQGKLMLLVNPGKTYFLDRNLLSPFIPMGQWKNSRVIIVGKSAADLHLTKKETGVEICNPTIRPIEINDVRVTICLSGDNF